MSNVTQLPVPLTINERFLRAFLDAEASCAALGLVEEARQVRGFVAARINESLPIQAARSGGDFGYELLGTDRYEIVHLILNFPGLQPYDILLNPNNPVVRKVLDVMRETAQYFIFVIVADGMTAFHKDMDEESLDWFNRYGRVVHTSTTTIQEYERGLRNFTKDDRFMHGKLLSWVCREDMAALDSQEDRFEVRSG